MEIPLQITFRGMDHSDAIEAAIRKRALHLERFNERITGCHVVVDVPHRHQHKGRQYALRIDITTPTGEIVVTRNPTSDYSHEDMNAVIRDAFDAAARQLEDTVRRRRGDVKTHEEAVLHGRVVRVFPGEGYGFLTTADELEVYFHENSVADGFASLEVGQEVRFTLAPDDGEQGPRAASVRIHQP